MTDTPAAPEHRTIETAVAGDGFLFDGKNWHHYIHADWSLAALLKELSALRSEMGPTQNGAATTQNTAPCVERHKYIAERAISSLRSFDPALADHIMASAPNTTKDKT